MIQPQLLLFMKVVTVEIQELQPKLKIHQDTSTNTETIMKIKIKTRHIILSTLRPQMNKKQGKVMEIWDILAIARTILLRMNYKMTKMIWMIKFSSEIIIKIL